jgi:hypothetical protein
MGYFESAEGQVITKARAIREIEKHGAYVQEFLAECGEHDEYQAQSVLTWLGY